jgi:hypothetical protein
VEDGETMTKDALSVIITAQMRHAVFAALLFACPCAGQSVLLPSKAEGGINEWVIVAPHKLTVDFALVNWRTSPGLTEVPIGALFPGTKPQAKVYRSSKPGRYKVEAWVEADAKLPLDRSAVLAILQDKTLTDPTKVENASSLLQGISACNVTIGEPGPDPKPPDPKPPDPKPPAPIPVDGFRVLIVYESADSIPAAQRLILTAQEVRQYLNSKCVMGAANKEWRIWDKDVDTSGETKLWQDAMRRPRQVVPWIIISDHPRGGFEGPLPKTLAETMTLLRKYGGQ